ncbi:MAG: tetratricopeptide repeat protein [Spirochaetales bacterium]|nr:tetratricopeptide repeat protein [Spirochaetales bacterium]
MSLPVLIAVLGFGVLILVLVLVTSLRGSKSRQKKNKDSQSIIRTATRALAQNPKDANALSELGDVYFSDQNWEKAATVYSTLADLVATNPGLDEHVILMRQGLASMQLKQYQSAYRNLVLASRDHKDVFEINYNLGQLELKRKNYERAVALLRSARGSRPDHVPTTRFLGQALFRVKRFSDAVGLLQKVIQAKPDDKECMFYLGQTNYELGQLDQAGKIFRQLRADPTYGARSALISGSLHLKNRLYDEAEADFQIGLKHESIPPEVLLELKYRLAATYSQLQDMDKSLAIMAEISRVNPAYKDVAAQIARGRELAGNKNLQTYLMAPPSEFVGLCRRIVTSYFRNSTVKITDINVNRSESADLLAEIRTPKWEDITLFRFMRTTGQTGELVLRDLQSRMKDLHASRGFCLSAGVFSDGAQAFVEARFVDLVAKDTFLKILGRA